MNLQEIVQKQKEIILTYDTRACCHLLFISLLLLGISSCGKEQSKPLTKPEQITRMQATIDSLNNEIASIQKELSNEVITDETYVKIDTLRFVPFQVEVNFLGKMEAENVAVLSPEIPGKLVSINVREGQKVAQGTVLSEVYAQDLRDNIERVQTELDFAKQSYERLERLYEQKIGSEMEYLQAQTTYKSLSKQLSSLEAQLSKTEIKAPFSGTIDAIYLKRGEAASGVVPFAKIINTRKLKVYADISEEYVQAIRLGDKLSLIFPTMGDTLRTSISHISEEVDEKSRTIRIRTNFTNSLGLKPHMVTNVLLQTYFNPRALVVPTIVLRSDLDGQYLFVAQQRDGMWIAKKRYLTIGKESRGFTEILDGLKEHDIIIRDGFDKVINNQTIVFN